MPAPEFSARVRMMFAYRDIVVRAFSDRAEMIRNHEVIGTSNGATRVEIERDIDRILDGEGAKHG